MEIIIAAVLALIFGLWLVKYISTDPTVITVIFTLICTGVILFYIRYFYNKLKKEISADKKPSLETKEEIKKSEDKEYSQKK